MTISKLVFVAATMMASACGGGKAAAPAPATSEATSRGPGMPRGMCPMQVPGTQVSAEDTKDGVAMVFTTTGDVTELRQRVHHKAAMHDRMAQGGATGPGHMGPGHMGPGHMGPGHKHPKHMMSQMVPSSARVEDTDRGARIELTPKDSAKLAELRAHVRERAEHMASGQCPMAQANH